MGISVSAPQHVEIFNDPEGAQQSLVEFAAVHRKGISHLIAGAHSLGIPYNKAFYLQPKECHWIEKSRTYDIFIIKNPNDPMIEKIVHDVTADKLKDMRIWWMYLKKPDIIEVLNFIRTCIDSLGLAISAETKLPVGYMLDSRIMGEPIVRGAHSSNGRK